MINYTFKDYFNFKSKKFDFLIHTLIIKIIIVIMIVIKKYNHRLNLNLKSPVEFIELLCGFEEFIIHYFINCFLSIFKDLSVDSKYCLQVNLLLH